MSQERQEGAPPNLNQAAVSPRSQDWFLEMLVDIVTRDGISFGITLNVGGVLVSGELVSYRKYFEGFAEDFKGGLIRAGFTPDNAEIAVKAFREVPDFLTSIANTNEQGGARGTPPSPRPGFIHLRNARFFHPGEVPVPANKGVWWRGRLNAVDGFILGSLSVSQ